MKNLLILFLFCFLFLGLTPDLKVKPSALPKQEITIAAVGDIMMGSAYPAPVLPKDDGQASFNAVLNQLQEADVTFGNLEGVLLDKGQTTKCQKSSNCFAFRMPERYALHLQHAGFDLLSVANNHSGDFNETGRVHTAKALSKAGIAFAGFKSHPYTIFVKDGVKYGFCAFSPNEGTLSMNHWDVAQNLIADLKRMVDLVIVSFHGGAEGSKHQHVNRKRELFFGEDRGNVYDFAHAAIDAGADLVLGHGPHVTRAVDFYKNRFIAYSLGNFCTYGPFNLDGPNGLAPLLELKLNEKGEFISARVTSMMQAKNSAPVIDSEQGAWKLISQLTQNDIPEAALDFSQQGWIFPKNEN